MKDTLGAGGLSNLPATYENTDTAPTSSDTVVIDGQGKKVTVVETTTWGAIDFSAGAIGTSTGTQTVTLADTSTTSTWTGGLIDGATINTASSGLTIGAGTDAKKIRGGAKLNLAGTTNWTGGDLSTGGGAEIINTSIFNATFDGKITNTEGGTIASFKNKGTFNKTNATSGTTEIEAVFTNIDTASVVNVNGGTLKLKGGGESSKAINLANNTKLELGANYSFTGGNLSSTGTGAIEINTAGVTASFNGTTGSANLTVSAGTANFDGTHTGTGKLTLSGGTIGGSNQAEVGSLDFSAGNLNGKVKSNGATTISNTNKSISGGELTLGGTTDLAGGTVTLSNGGKITNQAGKSFRVNGDATLANGGGTGVATFTNDGSFEKLDGTGTTTVGTVFNTSSGGSVTVAASKGALKLSGGGKTSGNISVGSGSKLQVDSADYSFDGATLSGTGTVELVGATTTFKGVSGSGKVSLNGGSATFDTSNFTATQLSITNGTVSSVNGGSVNAAALDFSGGNLNGKVTTSGATTISNSNKAINGGDLTLGGATDLAGGTVTLSNGGKITNQGGSFRVNGDATLANGGGTGVATFTNNGSFEKLDGTGTTTVGTVFDTSSGGSVTVAANKGNLKLSGGGKTSGSVSVGSGAKVQVDSANYSFDGATLGGTGTVELVGATTTFKGVGGSGKVSLNGGNATFDTSNSTAAQLSIANGTVSSSNGGSVSVGALDFSGGNLNGKVTTSGATTISNSNKGINGGDLTLGGATDLAGGTVTLSNGGKITNQTGKSFRVNGDATLANGGGTGVATFTNNGSFEKLDGTGTTTVGTQFDTSSGGSVTIAANKGNLKLSGGGRTSGNVSVGNGAKLQVDATDYSFDGATLGGTGTVELIGATTTFKGVGGSGKVSVKGGNARFDDAASIAGGLTLETGTITSNAGGSAEVGTLDWKGGSLNAKVKSNGNASITGNAKFISGGDLTLGGTTTWDGTSITTGNGAKLKNDTTGIFNANDGQISDSATGIRGKFTNAGSFKKNSGTGITDLGTDFDNSGTVEVTTGKLKLSKVIKNLAGGKFDVNGAGILELSGDVELAATSELKGNGRSKFLTGTLLANTLIDILNFDFEGGALGGTNTFSGIVNWTGGDWSVGSGNDITTIAAGAILNLTKATGHDFNRRSIHNLGTVNWNDGNLRSGNGGVFINDNIFNDLNASARSIESPGKSGGFGGAFSFTNNGTYRKTNGGTTTIEIDFTNNGGIDVTSGAVIFTGAFTNHGSVHLNAGGSAKFTTSGIAPLTFGKDNPLSGTGTIDAAFVRAEGLVSPGNSPGTLSLTGNLTLIGTSELLIELSGTGRDLLSVGGAAAIDGRLSLALLSGFGTGGTILPTDTFTVVTAAGGLTGVFSNVANGGRLFVDAGSGSFQVNYGPNSLTLTNFSAIPEPSTWALMGLGAAAVLFQAWRRRRTS